MSGRRGIIVNIYLSCLSIFFKSDLASISSASENDFVSKLVGNSFVWLGGKRACSNCKDFVWTDGTPMSYTNWKSGEPNNWVASKLPYIKPYIN